MKDFIDHLKIAGNVGLDEEVRNKIFTRVWEQYGPRISYFIAQIVPSEHPHFDDLFHDVMVKIFENMGRYDPFRSFEAWAFRIARNRCIDHLRTRRLQEDLEDRHTDIREDPAMKTVRSEMDRAVRKSLESLDPGDRQIAYLKYYEDLRNGQIAEIMGMNVNTVKTRLTGIKRRLRPVLEEWL